MIYFYSVMFPELPGFYFDPEKNRYFRLLPGHNNCNPLTKEKLQEKEREKQRQQMLAEDEMSRKVSVLCRYCSRFNNFCCKNDQSSNMIEFCQKKSSIKY